MAGLLIRKLKNRERGRRQGGFSLIEVLVALFLISVLVIALVNGLLTSTKATTTSNRSQRVGAAVTSFAETLRQMDYEPCADAGNYQADYENLINDPDNSDKDFGTSEMDSVTIDKVQYWMPGSYQADQPAESGKFIDSCDFPEGGAQLISFTIKWGADTETGEVVKRDPFAAGFIAATTTTAPPAPGQAAVVVASASPTSGNTPLEVHFSSDGSYVPNGLITRYKWDFKDGSTSSEPNPVHTFTNPGKFLVTLTVTDAEEPPIETTARVTVNVGGVPAVPTNLHKISTGQLGLLTGFIKVGWNPVPGAQNYQVEASQFSGTVFQCKITQDAGTSTTVMFTTNTWCSVLNLFPGINLKARVRVKVGSEWSAWSPEVSMQW